MQSQTAVTAYFSSKQLLLFGFALLSTVTFDHNFNLIISNTQSFELYYHIIISRDIAKILTQTVGCSFKLFKNSKQIFIYSYI